MFTTPEHAKKLLSANERIVRLSLADSQRTSLYVHPAFLKASSSVLCDMLDAVDSGLDSADISINAYYTIPLSDTNVKTWTTVLSIICPSAEPFKITWSNVMDLLLVAHKYDMPAVTGQVVAFLDAEEPTKKQKQQKQQQQQKQRYLVSLGYEITPQSCVETCPTRLTAYVTKLNVREVLVWLKFFSFCSLEQQVQQCLTQLRVRCTEVMEIPLTMNYLSSLQRTHADQLLADLSPSSK